MHSHFVLDAEGRPAPVDLLTWAAWYETAERHLGLDEVLPGVHVSIVFLGLNHAFGDGPPVLWETLVTGGGYDGYMDRYTSAEDAKAGHERICKEVLTGPGSYPDEH